MRLMIRFADKIVGVFIILTLGILVFVIFMLGSSQRWFSRDYYFYSYFNSAEGLNQNMAVQYKGFTIGHIKSIRLTDDDRVEVRFTIFDTHIDRVKHGSLVEIITSPLAALGGNQFLFYPGLGSDPVPEGETIPSASTSEGKRLLALGLADRPEQNNDISVIMNRSGALLGTLNDLLADLREAFTGTDRTTLGRTVGEMELAMSGIRVMAEQLPDDIGNTINSIMFQIDPILASIRTLSEKLADPDGTIMAILDSDGDVYTSLVSSIGSLAGTLQNVEKTSDLLPSQIAAMLADLHITLVQVQDILVSVANNPLLRRGIPERNETRTGGTHTRDVEF